MQTLHEMKRLTLRAIHSQIPRQAAEELLYFDASRNPESFADALRRWIIMHVDIVDEFEELLQGPELLITRIFENGKAYGDCDDVAMLAASMLASMGADVRFIAVDEQMDGSFGHVFVQYMFPRMESWRKFDPTIPYDPVINDRFLTMNVIS